MPRRRQVAEVFRLHSSSYEILELHNAAFFDLLEHLRYNLPMTLARNLTTGQVLSYDQPPEKAVVLAFYQSRHNYNWWSYNDWSVLYGPSGRTVSRGDWTALIAPEQLSLFDNKCIAV